MNFAENPRVIRHLTLACLLLLAAAHAGGAAVVTYSRTPGTVLNSSSFVSDAVSVTESGTVTDVNVTLTLHNPQIADVTIDLVDPTGTVSVRLFNRDGGVADGLYNVTFDDAAASSPPGFLTNGSCPTGVSYRPNSPLSAFNGLEINGSWTITVNDATGPDATDCDCDGLNLGPDCPRTFDAWSISFTYTPVVDADLTIAKTDGLTVVNQGGALSYTVTAGNDGPGDVVGATVSDNFPAGLTCTWTCLASAGSSCTVGPVAGNLADGVNLLAGGTATYTALCTVAASASGNLSNTATIGAPSGVNDADPSDNSATDSTAVNETPVADCRDVTVPGDPTTCTAAANVDDGSSDPDGDALVLAQSPAGPYALGPTPVTLSATDPGGLSGSCSATVTVVDQAAPVISCNAPPTIVPPDAPTTFTASASDACGAAGAEVLSYDCFTFTKKGKRVDKRGSCVVSFAGASLTIADSGGVGDLIDWIVRAVDGGGNSIQRHCQVQVVNPGRGH